MSVTLVQKGSAGVLTHIDDARPDLAGNSWHTAVTLVLMGLQNAENPKCPLCRGRLDLGDVFDVASLGGNPAAAEADPTGAPSGQVLATGKAQRWESGRRHLAWDAHKHPLSPQARCGQTGKVQRQRLSWECQAWTASQQLLKSAMLLQTRRGHRTRCKMAG